MTSALLSAHNHQSHAVQRGACYHCESNPGGKRQRPPLLGEGWHFDRPRRRRAPKRALGGRHLIGAFGFGWFQWPRRGLRTGLRVPARGHQALPYLHRPWRRTIAAQRLEYRRPGTCAAGLREYDDRVLSCSLCLPKFGLRGANVDAHQFEDFSSAQVSANPANPRPRHWRLTSALACLLKLVGSALNEMVADRVAKPTKMVLWVVQGLGVALKQVEGHVLAPGGGDNRCRRTITHHRGRATLNAEVHRGWRVSPVDPRGLQVLLILIQMSRDRPDAIMQQSNAQALSVLCGLQALDKNWRHQDMANLTGAQHRILRDIHEPPETSPCVIEGRALRRGRQ